MALFKFQNLNKHGSLRTRIVHSPTSQFSYKCEGLGKFVNVQRFKYEHHHYMAPVMQVRNGERFIMPGNVKVHPETTFDDILWVQPKKSKVKTPKNIFKFESKSDPGSFYKVTVVDNIVKCNCSGQYRAKDRQCRHMKEIKNKLGL
jgi:hypothetical protein